MGRLISKYFIHELQPIIGLYRRSACWFPSGHPHTVNTQMARNRGTQESGPGLRTREDGQPTSPTQPPASSLTLFSLAFGGSSPHLIQAGPQPQTWLIRSPHSTPVHLFLPHLSPAKHHSQRPYASRQHGMNMRFHEGRRMEEWGYHLIS